MRSALEGGTLEHGGVTLRRLLLVLAAAVLLGLVPFLSGLVGALMLFVITRRIHERFARIVPPRVSAFIIALGVFVLVLVPGTWFVSTIVREASDAVRSWRAGEAFTWLSRTPLGSLDVTKDIVNSAANVFTWLSGRAFALFGSLTTTMLNVVISLFGVYYLLIGAGPLWVRVKRLLPLPQHESELLAVRFAEVTEALLLGTVLTALLQGTIVGVAFSLFGLHPAVFWGFVTACASVLPLFGSSLVWLPGVAILLIERRVGAAVGLFAIGAVLASNLDNVVRLFLFRRVSGIHPMLTLVGAFAGIRLFGVIGALLGPLILSYFFELLTVYEQTTSAVAAPLPPPDQPYGATRASRGMSESGAQR